MNLIEKLELIERIDELVRRKATGSPKHLSSRLRVSQRNVFNIINTMKAMGAPICFCKNSNSYCYEEEVVFYFGFRAKRNAVYGGQKKNTSYSFLDCKIIAPMENIFGL